MPERKYIIADIDGNDRREVTLEEFKAESAHKCAEARAIFRRDVERAGLKVPARLA